MSFLQVGLISHFLERHLEAVISTNNRLVDNVVGEAVAFQGALLRFTAIASTFWASRAVELENVGIVVLDDITDVWQTAVADLDSITVEDLLQLGSSWEMPVN